MNSGINHRNRIVEVCRLHVLDLLTICGVGNTFEQSREVI